MEKPVSLHIGLLREAPSLKPCWEHEQRLLTPERAPESCFHACLAWPTNEIIWLTLRSTSGLETPTSLRNLTLAWMMTSHGYIDGVPQLNFHPPYTPAPPPALCVEGVPSEFPVVREHQRPTGLNLVTLLQMNTSDLIKLAMAVLSQRTASHGSHDFQLHSTIKET